MKTVPLSECVPLFKKVLSSKLVLLSVLAPLSQPERRFLPVFIFVQYLSACAYHTCLGEVWAGCPAVFQRKCTVGEIDTVNAARAATTKLAALHADENSKSFAEVEQERLQRQLLAERDADYDSSLGMSRGGRLSHGLYSCDARFRSCGQPEIRPQASGEVLF